MIYGRVYTKMGGEINQKTERKLKNRFLSETEQFGQFRQFNRKMA